MRERLGASGVICAEVIGEGEFRVLEAYGLLTAAMKDARFRFDGFSIAPETGRSAKSVRGSDCPALTFDNGASLGPSALVVALLFEEKTAAAIALGFRLEDSATFSEEEAGEFSALAALAGSLVQNANLLSWIEGSKKQWIRDFDAITDLIAVHDSRNCLIRSNRAFSGFFGASPAELVGARMSSLQDLSASCNARVCPLCLLSEQGRGEQLLIIRDRSYFVSTSHAHDAALEEERTIHVLKDMTAQRQAERRYRELFDSVQEGLFICDPRGRILEINCALAEMLGFERRSGLWVKVLEGLVPLGQRPMLARALESARAGTRTWNLQVPLRRSDGETRQYLLNVCPMLDERDGVHGIAGSVVDATETHVLRAKLTQAGKMAAIGKLVAGVAHEVNNPLSAILGFSQLLRENMEIPESAREELELIEQEALRMKSIVANLLQYARPAAIQGDFIDVNALLRDTLQLSKRNLELSGAAVTLRLDENAAPVVGDMLQLQQVFLNILKNAIDAVRESERKGRIEIEAVCDDLGLEITFRDNGLGLADPDSVFDPFYSTKEAGKGTGLGLSICYGVVQAHGGEISCENNVDGMGCAFHVRLPAAKRHQNLDVGEAREQRLAVAADNREQ